MADGDLASQVVPYVAATGTAYGLTVLDRVRDAATDATADATGGWGRRMLCRILHRQESEAAISSAIEDLATDPADDDQVATLRAQIRKALAADSQLAAEIANMLTQAGPAITAAGDRSIAAHTIS